MIVVSLETCALGCSGQLTIVCGNFVLDYEELCLKFNFDRPCGGDGREMFYDVCVAIKVLAACKGAVEKLDVAHAIHAEHTHFLPQTAVTYDVPVSVPTGAPVWF